MIKRSVSIRGHKTSISLEEPFWLALREIAARRGISVAAVIREIDDARSQRMARSKSIGGLSSAIRVAVLDAARAGTLAGQPGGPHPGSRG